MTQIAFRVEEVESRFLDPRRGHEPTVVGLQVRYDPLTGRSTHLSHFGAIEPQPLDLATYEDPRVKGYCPFCGDLRSRVTPKFPPDVVPEGRLSRGEALLFPNLFPYDAHGAVAVMTERHVVPLEKLGGRLLADALSLGIQFLRRIHKLDPSQHCPLMAWNYMPPSGGGLVHPHQQYFATRYPGNLYLQELLASEIFQRERRADYWRELVEVEESKGERFIGKTGSAHWLASFAPLGVLGEVLCVFPAVREMGEFSELHVADLVAGIEKVFRYFVKAEIHSFNATLFFAPAGRKSFDVHLRVAPRTFLNLRDFAPDLNFYQTLLQEPVCVVLPEDLCRDLQPYFR